MREKLFIFISIVVILLVLIGLNAASYTKQDKLPDNEYSPNRSTFNVGATGTRAFYELLSETGHKVSRWQEKPSFLLTKSKNKPNVFVIIGDTRREISDDDVKQILEWTAAGGKLVLIGRNPNKKFFEGKSQWKVNVTELKNFPQIDDSMNQQQMIGKTSAIKPIQPTIYTSEINAIQPSRLVSKINFNYELITVNPNSDGSGSGIGNGKVNSPIEENEVYGDEYYDEPPPMKTPAPVNPKATPTSILERTPTPISKLQGGFSEPSKTPTPTPIPTPANKFEIEEKKVTKAEYAENSFAPVVHFADKENTILVDFKYGLGEIVVLSDPYIVANNGITLVDNAQLGVNIVSAPNAIIAFDEYHQGYGASDKNFWTYFNDTPVQSIIGQICLLIALLFFAQSRRFGRPLPAGDPNRLSKLEYVSAMAELQQSTKAYDLAIENIYLQFKRTLIRFVGADNSISHKDLAQIISERSVINSIELYNLLNKCQSIVQGEKTGKREIVELTKQMREIEDNLGLKRDRKR
jgi:hypothetical protein